MLKPHSTSGLLSALDSSVGEFLGVLREADEEAQGRFIRGLLLSGLTDRRILGLLREAYRQGPGAFVPEVVGAVIFAFFSADAEEFRDSNVQAKRDSASAWLELPAVRDFLHLEYDVPQEYLRGELRLLNVGSTSLILRAGDNYVLKILKYRHRPNPRIAQATSQYKKLFGSLGEGTPTVHAAGSYYILMDFVPGPTLREVIQDAGPLERVSQGKKTSQKAASENLERVKGVFLQLTNLLESLHERPTAIVHQDLTPDNIILRPSATGGFPRVVLIDFGYNYVLQEGIGATADILSAQATVAPELSSAQEEGTPRSDLYSLGMILLFMLSGKAMPVSEVPGLIDDSWRIYPEFSDLIESLIDRRPENRLSTKPREEGDHEHTRILFSSAARLYEARHIEAIRGWRKIVSSIPRGLLGEFGKVLELGRQYKAVKEDETLARQARKLRYFALGSHAAHGLVLFVTMIYTLDDLGVINLNGLLPFQLLGPAIGVADFNAGSLSENIWGRLVGLTFSIVAVHYYISMFSGLTAKGVRWQTEFWLRFNSFCFALPILWLLIVRPQHWPFCAAVGVTFVTFNNRSTLRAAKVSLAEIEAKLDPEFGNRFKEFFGLYEAYGWNSGLYAGALLVVGIVLATGVAQDEMMYAIAVSILVNIMIMYVTACTKKGPGIRANLSRLYCGYRRARLVDEAKQLTPGGAVG